MRSAATISESEVSVGPLGGALMAVADISAHPIALILPGSGPTDRDGNSPLGIRAAPYRLLAQGLAQSGVSSVRIDKRGLFSSAAATSDPNAVTIADYVRDAEAWLDVMQARVGAAPIWLIGHSEGGLVALATASTSRVVAGVILLATPGRRLGHVLRMQLRANAANADILDEALGIVDSLESGDRIADTTMHPGLKPIFREEVQSFLIDALSYDPADLLRRMSQPVLVVQGTADIQVGIEDAQLLAAARPGVDLCLLNDVNHVLKKVPPDDQAANLAAYGNAELPLAGGVVAAVASYIRDQHHPA